MSAFEEFGVLPEIAKAIDELEWTLPTDVQAEAIPAILGGGDVLMAAETGSGKTAAFCIPIIQIVWETLKNVEKSKTGTPEVKSAQPWTMSIVDRDSSFVIAPCGLRIQSREFKDWHGGRCTTGVKNSGCWYYEATICDEGLCRLGWSTLDANLNLGTDRFGFGFGGTGKKSNNKQFDDYGEAFGKNDIIGCILNLDKGLILFQKNGKDLGVAFRLNDTIKNSSLFPAIVLKNAEMCLNFGHQSLKYLPLGCTPLSKAGSGNIAINTTSKQEINGTSIVKKKILNAPQAIIIEPSRELAEQTHTQIINLKKYLNSPKIKDVLLIGGANAKDQISQLNMGVDIVVGTPGRLEDFISSNYMSLSQCCFFVLDEADGLLKQGYTDLIDRLHKQMPKITIDGRRLQMIVCSATLHSFEVKKMADKLMHFPTWIDLKGEDAVPETVHHVVCLVDPQKDRSWQNAPESNFTDNVHYNDRMGVNSAEALSQAVKILKFKYCVQAIDEHNMDRAMIFCRTKTDCDNLERYFKSLSTHKYSCVCLHGDRSAGERKSNLIKFKENDVRFLICTDVAARGLDITGLPYMINITLPDEKSNYVHRIGRVGRAERMGLALSLVSVVPEKVWYHGQWCNSRGRNCSNTNLTDVKGCCIWYKEKQLLADIEEHLNVIIEQISKDFKISCNEFDGKVVYGEKRTHIGSDYKDHTDQMVPIVKELSKLESEAQLFYLQRFLTKIKAVK